MLNTNRLLSCFALSFFMINVAQGAQPESYPVQYMVSFVCGFVPPSNPGEVPGIKPGNYATIINIHNYTKSAVSLAKRISLNYASGEAKPPIIRNVVGFSARYRVLRIDCPDIWATVGVPPETYLQGMLHIGMAVKLPVAAVYTSQTKLDPVTPQDAGAGTSIDVEYMEPFVVLPQ